MAQFDVTPIRGFRADALDAERLEKIGALARKCRADALRMIAAAGTGHTGGVLSSIDLFLMLWLCADLPASDHIVVSHGHTAAGVYAVLGNLGFFDVEKAVTGFRRDGVFEGHLSLSVPGVEWCSGSLGQGLSVGCGLALAEKCKGGRGRVFVAMGDGEQQKGQLAEAREFAVQYALGNLIAVVDCNGLQASGAVKDIMPSELAAKYDAAGWRVVEADGHDFGSLYTALRECHAEADRPAAVLARTVMGKGVPEIEGDYRYHGKALSQRQLRAALQGLDAGPDAGVHISLPERAPAEVSVIRLPAPSFYLARSSVECRTAFGDALCAVAGVNAGEGRFPMAALDCDLTESIRLQRFSKEFPQFYFQCGIQEHNAATVAGALSRQGVLTFLVDFGVFGLDEVYAQHRMNDINGTSLKLVCTHCGLDVGEDGKTHQCIDALGVLSNLFGFRTLIPADANQAVHMLRFMAQAPGNLALLTGRSAVPVLVDAVGKPMFAEDYRFEYGKADWLRRGGDCTVIACGNMAHRACSAATRLAKAGVRVGVLNLCCPTDLDCDALREASGSGGIVTYEDHNMRTGIGSLVGAWLVENGLACRFRRLGVARYGVSAPAEFLYKAQGLDEDSLEKAILNIIG